jgi:hypothetical protein
MLSKRILSSITTIALCISFILPADVFAAASFTGGTNVAGGLNVAVPITDLQITGVGAGDIVPVFLYVPAGSLSMTTTTGLTFTGWTSGQRLYFSGTLTNVNAALATLRYTHSSAGTYTLEASIIGAGQIYDPATQHMYEVVNHGSAITATDARTAALARTTNGVTGYLANITSSEENAFVAARITQDGWFGASDAGVEGDWVWLDGPETGLVFWRWVANGTSFGYENWANDEPNQAGNEDCSQFYANGSGWNDLPCSGTLNYYIVEYGAPGNLPNIASDTLDITLTADTTTQAPTLTSPTSNSTQNTLQLIYTLPEVPTDGSVSVEFDNGTNTTTYIMGTSQSVNTPIYINRLASPSNQTWNFANLTEDYLLFGSWLEGHIGDGTYTVTLSYQDSLGNTASTDVATTVTIDTTAPAVVTITAPTPHAKIISTTSTVSGTCESGATVSISNVHLATNPTTTVCTDGAYSASISWRDSANNVSQTLTLKQTDWAGNIGNETTVIVDSASQSGSGGGSTVVPEKIIEPSAQTVIPISESTSAETTVSINDPEKSNEWPTESSESIMLNAANDISCTIHPYLKNPIRFGKKNNPEDVKLLEQFLNRYENANLPVDGVYSREDYYAVIKWQEKHADDVLKPWGLEKWTGYIFKTSLAKIKAIEENSCTK